MLSQAEQCSDDPSGHLWYENDLQLAAELGKALLERNVDLENQMVNLQQTTSGQESEIRLLRRQLEALRAVDESRARACEEIDRAAHDLEKSNARLQHERRTDMDTIKSLGETVSKLEQRCEELEAAVTAERARCNERERGRRREARRARSVPGRDTAASSAEVRGFAPRSSGTDSIAAALRLRLEVQRGRCLRAETELATALAENRDLQAHIQALVAAAAAAAAAPRPTTDERKSLEKEMPREVICSECKKHIAPAPFSEPFEHDLDELPGGSGRLVRLKNGGSAFGSRDSLYRIGLEPDDATPGREVCSAILAAGFQTASTPEDEIRTESTGGAGGSLLAELEEQYRKLVVRYETLIEAKSSSGAGAGKAESSSAVGSAAIPSRPQDLSLPTPDPTEGHFDNGPPEYKRLFREIFETLRRSAEFPTQPTTPGK